MNLHRVAAPLLLASAVLTGCGTTDAPAPSAAPAPTTSVVTETTPAPAEAVSEDEVVSDYIEPVNPVPILRSLSRVTPAPGTIEGETTPGGDRTATGSVLNENGNPSVMVDVLTFPANVPVDIAFPDAVHPEPSDMEHYITAEGVVIHVIDTTMVTATPALLAEWAEAVGGTVSK